MKILLGEVRIRWCQRRRRSDEQNSLAFSRKNLLEGEKPRRLAGVLNAAAAAAAAALP